jgi:LacI family transcriptional regulator
VTPKEGLINSPLTKLLLTLGHQRIAVLSGPQDVSTAVDRVAGYSRALAEAGLNADELLIYYGEFNQSAGYEMMQKALSITPWPTAVFGANNFIAIGALKALRDIGLGTPEDVALVAFDDLPLTLLIDPFLTTELLLTRLSGQGSAEYQEIVLPTEIIVRRSSGPPHREQNP